MHVKSLTRAVLIACVALSISVVHAQDTDSAKAFLQSVYAHYQKGSNGIDFAGPHADQYLHSSLIALIREDEKAVGPESVGVLDGDPVCGCQDWDGVFDLKIEIHRAQSGRAEASVSFSLFEQQTASDHRSLKIALAPERGRWRIYDIVDRSDPKAPFALREALMGEIDSLKSTRAESKR